MPSSPACIWTGSMTSRTLALRQSPMARSWLPDSEAKSRIQSPRAAWREPSILPGFGLGMGITLTYLTLIVLLPLSAVFLRTAGLTWREFIAVGLSERALAAYQLSFGAALVAGCLNAVFGLLLAWVLVRYRFPGKRLIDAMVDLPFALPTAVAGIAFTALYAPNGWIGARLEPLGLKIAFTPLGIAIVLVFVGLPFMVRTVQPVLQELGSDVEEAAASLGASRWQIFLRVIFPAIVPAVLTGFALAFARGVGEYGSVIFIAGNMPFKSEIAPLLIIVQLEQYNYAGATAIATVMLLVSFAILLLLNFLQAWSRRRRNS
jgi:sulfate/thiosulfate transport system permease protein